MINSHLKLLNIGCGATFHSAWTNLDLASNFPDVTTYDIRRELPFEDLSFDVLYCSHLLEHLKPSEVRRLLLESFRICKKRGIIRLVVPDLESIVRNYLISLKRLMSGDMEAEADYDWSMLELYDQAVRSSEGGMMKVYLKNPNIKNKDFVLTRVGNETFKKLLSGDAKKTLLQKIRSKTFSEILMKGRLALAKQLVHFISGRRGKEAFQEGIFRNYSGQIHKWMYDRFSIRRLMIVSGFTEIEICGADESRIPNFDSYSLDCVDGYVRKPDSLFVEGIKP